MKVKLILAVFFGVIVASHGAPCSDEGDCTLADDGSPLFFTLFERDLTFCDNALCFF
jgi:hypothetical protein